LFYIVELFKHLEFSRTLTLFLEKCNQGLGCSASWSSVHFSYILKISHVLTIYIVNNSVTVYMRSQLDRAAFRWFQGKCVKNDRTLPWSTDSCLKLDVYTQTDSSFVADNYTKSMVRQIDRDWRDHFKVGGLKNLVKSNNYSKNLRIRT